MVYEDHFVELNAKFNTHGNCIVKTINLLSIPLILYVLVILSYFNLIPLKVEIHSALLIGFIFLIYLFFVNHNAYRASCSFKKQFIKMKGDLKSYIEKHKVTINNTTKANASVDDFLSEFTRDLRNTNFSSVAAGIFPTLGILGTFISIAVSMPDFSSKTSAVLEHEISLLLGGVGTAFYVSIYGIFLSIWWIFFEKIGMSRFEHDIDVIKENTKSLFWNKIEIEKIHFQKSLDNFEKLNSLFSNVSLEEMQEKLDKTIEKKFAMLENMIEKEQHSMDISNEFFENKKQRHEEILNSYESIIKQIKNLVPVLDETLKNTGFLTKHFNKQEIEISKATVELNNNIGSLSNALEHFSAKNLEAIYANIIKSIETMKQDMEKIENRFEKQIDEYDENLEQRIKNSLEMIDKETANIVKQLDHLK